jgi:dihydroorotase (multifunctional complex type)
MHDLAIRGGRVWVGDALAEIDVAVDGERISGFALPSVRIEAGQTIDARGCAVLPGMIDMHVHTREPGFTHKEDFVTATRAAAAGGITTIVDMPSVDPPTYTRDLLLAKRALAATKCVVDWAHYGAATEPSEIPRMAEAGAAGFKLYQLHGDPRLCAPEEPRILQAFEAIASTGLICVAHPGKQEVFDALSRSAWARGEPRNHLTLCKVFADELHWEVGVGTLMALQRYTGVRLHLAHAHARGVLRMIREAKAEGRSVSAECDLRFFEFSPADVEERGPALSPGGFVIADPERARAIWQAFEDGTIDAITTDHAPHLREEVERQRTDAWTSAYGNPQLEHAVPVLLTDVAEGRLTLQAFVWATSESPARLLGLYPDKGTLAAGSHADLMLVDLEHPWTITDAGLQTKCGWTPYAGRTVAARVVATVLRGRLIMQDGRVLAEPGTGRYVTARPQARAHPPAP